ncbi:MAG: MucBP domain-containing protein, partial [Ruminococcus sp.]
MLRKSMIDSITYWAKEYHIDGFRFDLMGLHDCETMNQIRASLDNIDPQIIMYGEAWNMSTNCDSGTVLANQDNMASLDSRIGAFDDTIRDALKGNTFDATEKGFLASGNNTGKLKTGIEGQCNFGWATSPNQTVSYSSCHDNYTLYDKLVSSVYPDSKDYRKRRANLVEMTKLNSAVIFSSQGMTFFLAGEEFCRSKDGDENSYKSDVKINMIDWSSVDEYSDVVQYYKGMIDIRNKFKAFRDPSSNTAQSINYLDTEDGVVAFSLKGLEGDSFKNAVVVLNGNADKTTTVKIEGKSLPEKWVMIANDETAGLRNLGEVSGSVDAKPSSAVILVDKESYEKSCKSTNGAVVVDYIDSESGEKVMTEIVEGKIGEKYSITPGNEVLKKYKVLEKEDTTGTYDEENKHASFIVEAYKGTVSSVTIRYVDSQSEKEIAPSKVLTNHSGQQYFTEEIPSVKGYTLDTDALPENGAGLFAEGDKVVTYKYTKAKTKKCQVNVIYMDSDGNIMDIELLEGNFGDAYSTKEKEYDNLTLVSAPKNAKGEYAKTQQTVIYNYLLDDNTTKMVVVSIILALGAILAGAGIYLKARSTIVKKRREGIEIQK